MAALTEWLNLMLAEIARKREDVERARSEDAQRAAERDTPAERKGAVPTAKPRIRKTP